MSQLEQALQKFAAVVSILTAEQTREELKDTVDDIDDVTSKILDISQQVTSTVMRIFEDVMKANGSISISTSRRLTLPGDEALRQRAVDLLLSPDTPEEV